MMSPEDEILMHDALLESLEMRDAYACERQMVSALLGIAHAQQIELAALRKNYDLARQDLARYMRSQVA